MTDTTTQGGTPASYNESALPGQPAGEYRVAGKLGPEATDGLVITCSDRRIRRPVEHFLFKDLGLGNYDLIAVPGGAYILSFADILPKQLKLGTQMVKMMMQLHRPPRIVMIAHQDCGRYLTGFASKLRIPGFSLEQKQKHDLRSVTSTLRELFSQVPVDAFYARYDTGESVVFEPVQEPA